MFAIGEDIAGARVFLRPHAMDVMGVRDLDDLVAFHRRAIDACHPGIGLVVGKQVAPVIGAVGERHMRMVQIAIVVGDLALGLEIGLCLRQQAFGQNLERFVGLPPAGCRAAVEHRNAHQFTHRGHTENTDFAGLPRRPETVIFVKFSGRHPEPVAAIGCVGGSCAAGGDGSHPCNDSGFGRTTEKIAAGHAFVSFILLHGCSPYCRLKVIGPVTALPVWRPPPVFAARSAPRISAAWRVS